MDIIQAKISEINNLNLIYIYTIDSAFKDGSNKYVGAKVVYGKNSVFELDYRDSHFEELLKTIITTYRKEKDDRKIILLGNLSKRLVSDEYFKTSESITSQEESITYLSSNNMYIYKYKDLIFEVIKSMLLFYNKYDLLTFSDLKGYNNKWTLEYKNGIETKMLPLIIYIDSESNLCIKVTNLDGTFVNIDASIILNKNELSMKWNNSKDSINAEIKYDYEEKKIIHIIKEKDKLIDKYEETTYLSDVDKNIIEVYESILQINLDDVIRIGDYSYIKQDLNEEVVSSDETVYKLSRTLLSINPEVAFYEKRSKNGLSKYGNEVLVTLDELIETSSFVEDDNNLIIIENNTRKYGIDHITYEIIENATKLKLTELNDIYLKEKIEDEVKSIDGIKRYIRKKRG